MPALVLVHIGRTFPEYLNDCIAQVESVSDVSIHLLIDGIHRDKISSKRVELCPLESITKSNLHLVFDKKTQLNAEFRGGFWKFAMQRFFYLHDYILAKGLIDVFHIENDNLIYLDFLPKIDVFRSMPMWCVMDSPARCIASFMYFRGSEMLSRFLDTYLNTYSGTVNDMEGLAKFRNENVADVGVLPIVGDYVDVIDPMYSAFAQKFGYVFDAAALGQFIGGVDPRNIGGNTCGFINETSVIKCDKMKVEWVGNKPYLNGLPVLNLHIHSKDLKRWSCLTTNKKSSLITGEKIQEKCDVYVGSAGDFDYNPYFKNQKRKWINIDTLVEPWDNPRLVFCYGNSLLKFQSKILLLKNPFILVSHNADQEIDERFTSIFSAQNLLFWHAQNVLIKNKKLGGLPIGFANSMWKHGDIDVIQRIGGLEIDKVRDFYFYFSMHTNKAKREDCRRKIEGSGLTFDMPLSNYETYLRHLATHKYSICPPGNGVDSHRIWECLYLNVIPVLLRSEFSERVCRRFPCILLDDWRDFNADDLLDSYERPEYSVDLNDILLGTVDYFDKN